MTQFIRKDNMSSTRDNALLRSGLYYEDDVQADVENGTIVAVGEFIKGERELHKITPVTSTDIVVGIISTPEVDYKEVGYNGIDTFVNKAGVPVRIDLFQIGDTFSIGNSTDTNDLPAGKNLICKHQKTEIEGRHTYQVYEVQPVDV